MSYRSNIVYVYDGSFDGLLSVIFDAFSRREVPEHIFTYANEENTLFAVHQVENTEDKAKRVGKWLKGFSSEVFTVFYYGYLTCIKNKEMELLMLAIKLNKEGKNAIFDVSSRAVHNINKGILALKNESHLFCGFVRFAEYNGVLVSEIQPKNVVLPVILKHFETRFPNENYMIIDRTNKTILVHDRRGSHMVPYTDYELPPIPPNELMIQNLWCGFYDTASIELRQNLRCRMGHMPKRYWATMTEMKDLLRDETIRSISTEKHTSLASHAADTSH